MNKQNFDVWIAELRTTDKKQGKNTLKRLAPDGPFYCCLGIGCELAGIEETVKSDDFDTTRASAYFGGYSTLAPREFIEWLGMPPVNDVEVDIYPDWPERLEGPPGRRYSDDASAASMNDSGDFTFAQIADVFAYFGIKED